MEIPKSNLAYYAANAPAAPDWFTATPLPPSPITEPDVNMVSGPEQAAAAAYKADGTVPMSPSPQMVIFMAAVDTWKNAEAYYVAINTQEAFFQWRWFYARQMVSREAKGM